jgi:hypothetical protein
MLLQFLLQEASVFFKPGLGGSIHGFHNGVRQIDELPPCLLHLRGYQRRPLHDRLQVAL